MDNNTRAGTAGDTFLAFIANLGKEDILIYVFKRKWTIG